MAEISRKNYIQRIIKDMSTLELGHTGYSSIAKVHYHDNKREQSHMIDEEEPEELLCAGCRNSIDPDVCWCGEWRPLHHAFNLGHEFVPMGCDCYKMAKPSTEPDTTPDLPWDLL